jgi:outer membrane protein TolC
MKKFKKNIIALSLVALNVTSINALNIDEAVELALKKNLDIQAQAYEYQASKQSIAVQNSGTLPKFDVAVNYNKNDEVITGYNKKNGTASAVLSYNLFNGFATSSNVDSAEFLFQSSSFTLKALKEDITLNTKSAYINYLDEKNALETYISAYELFKNQFKDSKNKYDQGLLAKNDLLQVQVNILTAKQNVVKAKGDLKIAKFQLSNILGGYDLKDENIENLKSTTFDDLNLDEQVLENRSEIQALKMNVESLKEQNKVINSDLYPKVDLSLTHNNYYEKSINTQIDKQNTLGLSASWNIYGGGSTKAQDKIYKTNILKAKSQLAKTRLDIKLQYENAKSDLEVANDNLETATLALEQAKENYNIVDNRFNEGISSSTDLTDANYLLTSAKQSYHRAYFDKFLAQATLKRVFEIK